MSNIPYDDKQERSIDNILRALVGKVGVGSADSNELALSDAQYSCLMASVIHSHYPAQASSPIIDSCAHCHITFDKALFETFTPTSGSSVEMGTKAKAQICGRGDVLIHVKAGKETYLCHFQTFLHVSEFENTL